MPGGAAFDPEKRNASVVERRRDRTLEEAIRCRFVRACSKARFRGERRGMALVFVDVLKDRPDFEQPVERRRSPGLRCARSGASADGPGLGENVARLGTG